MFYLIFFTSSLLKCSRLELLPRTGFDISPRLVQQQQLENEILDGITAQSAANKALAEEYDLQKRNRLVNAMAAEDSAIEAEAGRRVADAAKEIADAKQAQADMFSQNIFKRAIL